MSGYCSMMVVEDKVNFFSRVTSLVSLKCESTVMGVRIGEEI